MTREEAIEKVKTAFDAWEYNYDTGDDWSKEHEARDMAIKALEQQQSEDCISRREMLKYQEYLHGKMPNEENHKLWKFINRLPPVTPQQTRWIAVSEGLPKNNSLVLVTVQVGNRNPKVRSGYYYKDGHFHIDNGDSWESRDRELVAWQPLPEPYVPDINVGKLAAESEDKE